LSKFGTGTVKDSHGSATLTGTGSPNSKTDLIICATASEDCTVLLVPLQARDGAPVTEEVIGFLLRYLCLDQN
jgi:hypothetical protein